VDLAGADGQVETRSGWLACDPTCRSSISSMCDLFTADIGDADPPSRLTLEQVLRLDGEFHRQLLETLRLQKPLTIMLTASSPHDAALLRQ
jgi:hypothetical protein